MTNLCFGPFRGLPRPSPYKATNPSTETRLCAIRTCGQTMSWFRAVAFACKGCRPRLRIFTCRQTACGGAAHIRKTKSPGTNLSTISSRSFANIMGGLERRAVAAVPNTWSRAVSPSRLPKTCVHVRNDSYNDFGPIPCNLIR